MRVWQVKFEVHQPLPSMPIPNVVVEEVQNHPSYMLDGRLRKDKGGQLSITIGGRGCFRLDDQIIELTPGVAFLHNHTDPRTGYFYPKDEAETWRFLWIAFHSETVEQMIADINARYGYIFHLPLNCGLVRKLVAYHNYRGAVQVLTPLAGARLVMDIFAGLGDTFEHRLISNPQSILVSKAQEYVISNISRNIKLTDIATALQISREHLSRVFCSIS